ncbi:unnamed protein product [Amoebophrya sp. A120]|nr:unnamed protein product [Amoebophrya sp. A120]|eukprot:GSA120T00022690001.1
MTGGMPKKNPLEDIPSVGFGTAHLYEEHIFSALQNGVRHLDCARLYANEDEVGRAVTRFLEGNTGGVTRSDLWITSKLWCEELHPSDVRSAVLDSLNDLQSSYLDLLLIHWPRVFVKGKPLVVDQTVSILDTWNAMETLVQEGLVRNLGVSNFDRAQLATELLQWYTGTTADQNAGVAGVATHADAAPAGSSKAPKKSSGSAEDDTDSVASTSATSSSKVSESSRPELLCSSSDTIAAPPRGHRKAITIWPYANQIELHPHFQQQELVNYLQEREIRPVAWGPLNFGRKSLAKDEILMDLAKQLDSTVQQVALRWNLQRGVVVIPSSTNPTHVRENLKCGEEGKDVGDPRRFAGLSSAQLERVSRCDQDTRRFPDIIGIWPTSSTRTAQRFGAFLSFVLDKCVFRLFGPQCLVSWRKAVVRWKKPKPASKEASKS